MYGGLLIHFSDFCEMMSYPLVFCLDYHSSYPFDYPPGYPSGYPSSYSSHYPSGYSSGYPYILEIHMVTVWSYVVCTVICIVNCVHGVWGAS